LYALKYGVSHFILFDYVSMIFFEIPDRSKVSIGELPNRDLVNVALQRGEREVCVHARTAVRKYDDTGIVAILGNLFAFMYHDVNSTNELDDDTGFRGVTMVVLAMIVV
jgi:hypothetical protein